MNHSIIFLLALLAIIVCFFISWKLQKGTSAPQVVPETKEPEEVTVTVKFPIKGREGGTIYFVEFLHDGVWKNGELNFGEDLPPGLRVRCRVLNDTLGKDLVYQLEAIFLQDIPNSFGKLLRENERGDEYEIIVPGPGGIATVATLRRDPLLIGKNVGDVVPVIEVAGGTYKLNYKAFVES